MPVLGAAGAWGRLGSLRGDPPPAPSMATRARPPAGGPGLLGAPAAYLGRPPSIRPGWAPGGGDPAAVHGRQGFAGPPAAAPAPAALPPGSASLGGRWAAGGGSSGGLAEGAPSAGPHGAAMLAAGHVEVDRRCVGREGGDARVALAGPLPAPPAGNTVQRAHGLASLQGAHAACCPACLRAWLGHLAVKHIAPMHRAQTRYTQRPMRGRCPGIVKVGLGLCIRCWPSAGDTGTSPAAGVRFYTRADVADPDAPGARFAFDLAQPAHAACFNVGVGADGGTLISWSPLHALYALPDGSAWAEHALLWDADDLARPRAAPRNPLSVHRVEGALR
jgi:hypothetical protein